MHLRTFLTFLSSVLLFGFIDACRKNDDIIVEWVQAYMGFEARVGLFLWDWLDIWQEDFERAVWWLYAVVTLAATVGFGVWLTLDCERLAQVCIYDTWAAICIDVKDCFDQISSSAQSFLIYCLPSSSTTLTEILVVDPRSFVNVPPPGAFPDESAETWEEALGGGPFLDESMCTLKGPGGEGVVGFPDESSGTLEAAASFSSSRGIDDVAEATTTAVSITAGQQQTADLQQRQGREDESAALKLLKVELDKAKDDLVQERSRIATLEDEKKAAAAGAATAAPVVKESRMSVFSRRKMEAEMGRLRKEVLSIGHEKLSIERRSRELQNERDAILIENRLLKTRLEEETGVAAPAAPAPAPAPAEKTEPQQQEAGTQTDLVVEVQQPAAVAAVATDVTTTNVEELQRWQQWFAELQFAYEATKETLGRCDHARQVAIGERDAATQERDAALAQVAHHHQQANEAVWALTRENEMLKESITKVRAEAQAQANKANANDGDGSSSSSSLSSSIVFNGSATAAGKERAGMLRTIRDLATDKAALSKEVKGLRSANEDLAGQVARLGAANVDLANKVGQLETEVDVWKQTNDVDVEKAKQAASDHEQVLRWKQAQVDAAEGRADMMVVVQEAAATQQQVSASASVSATSPRKNKRVAAQQLGGVVKKKALCEEGEEEEEKKEEEEEEVSEEE
ncbi:hypothetical protein H2204_002294 [Knufia peltigerae]|uniref:Uncharacterized protein n=1 Tax=Knufia peltigerae TaxID=1002370 RepID=A0AA38YB81_9EURO|nr:hypothetical protein H2204_002294 [Knufia peltigerae]